MKIIGTIDPEIKPFVYALNGLRIETGASCQGKPNGIHYGKPGYSNAWVEFCPHTSPDRLKDVRELANIYVDGKIYSCDVTKIIFEGPIKAK